MADRGTMKGTPLHLPAIPEARRGPGRPPNPPPPPAPRVRGDSGAVVRELGGQAVQVKLYRREGVDWAYLDSLDGAGLTLDVMKDEYGPGKYQARWDDADGSEREYEFSIARSVQRDEGQASRDPLMPVVQRLMDRLDQMERQNRSPVDRSMMELLLRRDQPTRDPLLETLITSLVNSNKASASGGPMDLVTIMKLVEDARRDGMSVAEKLAALGSGGDSTAAVLSTIRDVGVPLAEAVSDRMRQTTRARLNAPKPGEATAVARVPKWLNDVRPFGSFVIQWAQQNVDGATVARRVLDALSDTQFAELGDTLGTSDDGQLGELLKSAIPQLAHYPGWLAGVVPQLRQLHAEASGPDEEEATDVVTPPPKATTAKRETKKKEGATDGQE